MINAGRERYIYIYIVLGMPYTSIIGQEVKGRNVTRVKKVTGQKVRK